MDETAQVRRHEVGTGRLGVSHKGVNKVSIVQNALVYERRQCEALTNDLQRLKKEQAKADQEFQHLCAIEEKVARATLAAEEAADALEAHGARLGEELSQLRVEKQELQKKVHVATTERRQLVHACDTLCADNDGLHKSAQQLAAKIDKVHAERLHFISESEYHKAQAAKAEAQLEKLEVKLRGVQQVALTSVAGFMSQ